MNTEHTEKKPCEVYPKGGNVKMKEPTKVHKPGQIPVNTPTCTKCGKSFLDCKCFGSIHAADAEIASDTNQFDNLAGEVEKPAVNPEMVKSQQALMKEINRYYQLVNVLLNSTTNKDEPFSKTMLGGLFVQVNLARAEIITIEKILEEMGVKPEEYLAKVAAQLDQMLALEQIQYKVIITPDGVLSDHTPK